MSASSLNCSIAATFAMLESLILGLPSMLQNLRFVKQSLNVRPSCFSMVAYNRSANHMFDVLIPT